MYGFPGGRLASWAAGVCRGGGAGVVRLSYRGGGAGVVRLSYRGGGTGVIRLSYRGGGAGVVRLSYRGGGAGVVRLSYTRTRIRGTFWMVLEGSGWFWNILEGSGCFWMSLNRTLFRDVEVEVDQAVTSCPFMGFLLGGSLDD